MKSQNSSGSKSKDSARKSTLGKRPISDIIPKNIMPEESRFFQKVFRGEVTIPRLTERLTKKNRIVTVEVTATLVSGGGDSS